MIDTLARASVDGAVFASVVWVISRAVPGLPAGAKSFLWWCAAAKFALALVWTTPVLLPVLPPAEPVATYAAVAETRATSSEHISVGASADGQPAPTRGVPWSMLVLAAWGLGCGVAAYRGLSRCRGVHRVVGCSTEAPEYVQLMTADLGEQLGLRRLPEVRVSDEVVTPLVTGLRRPVILLPLERFGRLSLEQQRMTLCHELVHLKRGDLWLGCVPAVAERLFFFHPLSHVAVREYLFWREAACDAAVIQTLDVAPQEYGGLLLNLGVVRPRASLAAAGAPWSFSILKRRIVMLRDPSSRSLASRVVATVVAGLAVAAIAPLQLSARPSAVEAPTLFGVAAPEAVAADDVQRAKTDARDEKLNFVLFFDEDRTTMSGSVPGDINRAKRLKRPGEPMAWFRMGGREYVVRDPAVLREIQEAWGPPNEIGSKQGEIGARQGIIGAKQGEIGARQGEVGMEQSGIGAKQGMIGTRQGRLAAQESSRSLTEEQKTEIEKERRVLDDQMKVLDQEMRKLDGRMRALDAPMRELDEQMKVLDREMSAMDGRMEEAVKRAEETMRDILQRAISSGAAETVK